MLNKTNIEHGVIGLLIQAAFFFLTGSIWLGFAIATAFFLGREHAQREYKIGNPSLLKGYEAFDFWNWKLDAILDLVVPSLLTLIVAIVVTVI